MQKIAFVGGHHTTAFAVIDRFLELTTTPVEIVWIGHRHSMEKDKSESREYQEVTARGWKFYNLKTPKFHLRLTPLFWVSFIGGILRAGEILFKEKPRLVMCFGGYLSVPVAVSAFFLRIPVFTHEQTSRAGFANRAIAGLCRKVLISFDSSRRYFPKSKVEFSGNPIRRQVFEDRGLFNLPLTRKTIYVTGGKQGAHRINLLIAPLLPRLLENYNVIHQCGSNSVFNDRKELAALSSRLPESVRATYILKEYFGSEEIGSVYARADLVIGRSGANTVCELGALKKRCLLIPLPKSSHNEQLKNAELLASLGLARIVEETALTPGRLLTEISGLLDEDYSGKSVPVDEGALGRLFPRNGAEIVAQKIIELTNLVPAIGRN